MVAILTQTHTEFFYDPPQSLIRQGIMRRYAVYLSVGGACDV